MCATGSRVALANESGPHLEVDTGAGGGLMYVRAQAGTCRQ